MTPQAQAVLDAWEDARDARFFEDFAGLGPEFAGATAGVRYAALARMSEALHHLDEAAGLNPGNQPGSAAALRVFYDPLLRRWPK